MDLVQQFNNDSQMADLNASIAAVTSAIEIKNEALTAARAAMLECQHNAHKGKVCFDGDEWHLVLEQIDKALAL